MITRRFTYHLPRSVAEATGLLATTGHDAVVIGGGTWVVPEMTHGLRRPAHVIDLRRAGLATIRLVDASLVLGATTTYSDVLGSPLVRQHLPLLATLAGGITGGAAIRNVGTLGGSACYANPASDVPAALVALNAVLRLERQGHSRHLPAGAFFRAAFMNALDPGEILADITIPLPPPDARFGYHKLKLCESSWPIATAACLLTLDSHGSPSALRLVLGGVGPTPIVVETDNLLGQPATATWVAEVGATAKRAVVAPWSDALASGEYRQRVAGVVAQRAVASALSNQGGAA